MPKIWTASIWTSYGPTLLPAPGTPSSSTDTVMTVDRTGEQHYSSAEGLGVAIDLREADGAAGSDAIVKAAVEWLGERLERGKLERLGSLMPWHEFK